MAALYTTECAFQYRDTCNLLHRGHLLQAIGSLFSPVIQERIRICYTEVDEINCELSMTCLYVSPDMPQICGKQYLSQIDATSLLKELKNDRVISIENTLTSPLMQGKEQVYLAAGIRSELLCPILADNRIVCVFSLHRNDIHAWSQQEISDFKKAALDIYLNSKNNTPHKWAEKTIMHQNTILTSIKLIHEKSVSCRTIEELTLACLHILEKVTGSSVSFLSDADSDGMVRNIVLNHSNQNSFAHVLADHPLPQSSQLHRLHGSVILKGNAIMANNPAEIPGTQYIPNGHPAIFRFIGVPYSINSNIRGVAAVANKEIDYTEQDLEVLEVLTPIIMESIQRKRAETALEQSEQHALLLVEEIKNSDHKRNVFLSTLSHELRNPLSTITASMHLLDTALEGKCSEKTKIIMNRQLKQLCCLADDLLDYTRIQSDKMKLKKIRTEMRDLIINIVEDYQSLFSAREIRLIKDIQISNLYLNIDPIRLTQLIGNLLDNALKHTGKDGTVIVSLSKTNSEAIICVKDNGIGIRPDMLPLLFQPYIQDEQIPQHNTGLGLGLSIAIGIAKLHGGTIAAHSDGIGTGAAFSVHLPIVSNKLPLDMRQRTKATVKVLLIDGNREYIQMLCCMLRHTGYITEFAFCGEDGLKKVPEFIPHVVFCAVRLPDMNSSEVAHRIRYSLKNAYLVAMAGYKDRKVPVPGIPDGFDTYLTMPADMQSIKQLLNEIPAARDNSF